MNNKYYMFIVLFAFAAMICFFNVQSAWADENNRNTFLIILGAIFMIATGVTFYLGKKNYNKK